MGFAVRTQTLALLSAISLLLPSACWAEETVTPNNTSTVAPVQAERPVSRLSRLSLNQDTLYLPTRLVLGESNRFLIKSKPGSEVMLYISPKQEGYKLPNGLAIGVGETYESIGGKVPENGVLELQVPVPDEGDWEGHYLFVDAITWTQSDYSDVKRVQLLDATGRRTADNALVMMKPGKAGNNPLIMPSMPGLSGAAMSQINQMSQIMGSNDGRKKDLLDYGSRNADTMLDRNSLMNRPGSLTSPLQGGR